MKDLIADFIWAMALLFGLLALLYVVFVMHYNEPQSAPIKPPITQNVPSTVEPIIK